MGRKKKLDVNRHDPKVIAQKKAARKATREKRAQEIEAVRNAAAAEFASSRPEDNFTEVVSNPPAQEDMDRLLSAPEPEKPTPAPAGDTDPRTKRNFASREKRRATKKEKEHLDKINMAVAAGESGVADANKLVEDWNKSRKLEEMPSGVETLGDTNLDAAGNPVDVSNMVQQERELRGVSSDKGVNLPGRAGGPVVDTGRGAAGVFIPFSDKQSDAIIPTGPEQPSTGDLVKADARERRGMGEVGSERDLVSVKHMGVNIQVTPEIKKAYELYKSDWMKNPARANGRALGAAAAKDARVPVLHPETGEHMVDPDTKEKLYNHPLLNPIRLKGIVGGYETLAAVQMKYKTDEAGIRKYGTAMGLKYQDALRAMYNMAQEEKDSTTAEDMATKPGWLHPKDQVVHHETGERFSINSKKQEHVDYLSKMGVLDENGGGTHQFLRAKGTVSATYKDASGKMHTTNPVYLGWNRMGEAGSPGIWHFVSNVNTPGADPKTIKTPVAYVAGQIATMKSNAKREILPKGSVESRKLIHRTAYQLSQMAIDAANSVRGMGEDTTYRTQSGFTVDEGATAEAGRNIEVGDLQDALTRNKQKTPYVSNVADSTPPIETPELPDVPFGPKVGKSGAMPKYRLSHWNQRPDLVKSDEKTSDMSDWAAPIAEAPKPEQMSLPGLGEHGQFQFVGMPTRRVSYEIDEGSRIEPGTRDQLRGDATIYKRRSQKSQRLVAELQGANPSTPGPLPLDQTVRPTTPPFNKDEMVQRLGKVQTNKDTVTKFVPTQATNKNNPIESTNDANNFTSSDVEEVRPEGPLTKHETVKAFASKMSDIINSPAVPEVQGQAEIDWSTPEEKEIGKTSAFNHWTGRQWQNIQTGSSGAVKAARREDVASEGRAKFGQIKAAGVSAPVNLSILSENTSEDQPTLRTQGMIQRAEQNMHQWRVQTALEKGHITPEEAEELNKG